MQSLVLPSEFYLQAATKCCYQFTTNLKDSARINIIHSNITGVTFTFKRVSHIVETLANGHLLTFVVFHHPIIADYRGDLYLSNTDEKYLSIT